MVIVRNSIKTNAAVKAAVLASVKRTNPNSFDGFVGRGASMIAVIETMGVEYDPANTKITLVNLKLKQTSISAQVNDAKGAKDDEKQNIIDFNVEYKMMTAITTDSLNAYRASEDVLPEQLKIAGNNAKRVRGTRIIALPKAPPVVVEPIESSGDAALDAMRRNSVSFQKFDVRLGSFYTHIKYLEGVGNYDTNEARLKATALMTYYASLVTLRHTMEGSASNTNSKCNTRNEGLFSNTTGARLLYSQAKQAIASKNGLTGSIYRQVKGLSFPNLIKISLRTPTTNY